MSSFRMPLSRRALFALPLVTVFPAIAQTDYPTKAIRIIVPFAPGGSGDITSRLIGKYIEDKTGQPFVVENKPGANGIVGALAVKAAPADGYTLLSVAVTFARVPAVVKAAGYDPAADFAGVSLVCRIPQVLVLNANHPAKNLQELVAIAKAKPGEVSFGSSGNGSTGHVAAEMFMRMTGTKLLHVTYKGNAQAIVDVMGGQVAMMFDQVSTSAGHVKGGKLRALGVTTKTRSAVLPEVPTLHEQGLIDFEDVTWNGLVAPAGTPRPVLTVLHGAIAKALANPELQKKYGERGIEMVASRSPEDFSAYVKSEAEAFAKLVCDAGIKVE
jgi:tripartite-type tricarboxylate transporter receptor subunit TctC